jgi:hypothetical protein
MCHNCGKDYCNECLDEGIEYYYCKSPQCQIILNEELMARKKIKLICPSCKEQFEKLEKDVNNNNINCIYCNFLFTPYNTKIESNKYAAITSSTDELIIIDKSQVEFIKWPKYCPCCFTVLEKKNTNNLAIEIHGIKKILYNFKLDKLLIPYCMKCVTKISNAVSLSRIGFALFILPIIVEFFHLSLLNHLGSGGISTVGILILLLSEYRIKKIESIKIKVFKRNSLKLIFNNNNYHHSLVNLNNK